MLSSVVGREIRIFCAFISILTGYCEIVINKKINGSLAVAHIWHMQDAIQSQLMLLFNES